MKANYWIISDALFLSPSFRCLPNQNYEYPVTILLLANKYHTILIQAVNGCDISRIKRVHVRNRNI